MTPPRTLILALFVTFATSLSAKQSTEDFVVAADFPAISDADRGATDVGGAPAIVLLHAEQNEWVDIQSTYFLRIRRLRRVKILSDDGAAAYGDYDFRMIGDWRVKEVKARTVLPDGEVVDATSGVFQAKSDVGFHVVRVAFPNVKKGAILDLLITVTSDSWGLSPWRVQETIPVRESRFVLVPPEGLKYRVATQHLAPDELTAVPFHIGTRPAFAWTTRDVPAFRGEPFGPPLDDLVKTLFVIPQAYRHKKLYIPFAVDWKETSKTGQKSWDVWLDRAKGDAVALAKTAVAGAADTNAKVAAIQKALSTKVRVGYIASLPAEESANAVLSKGVGTSADLAATAVVMLRAVDVEADLVALRRRSSGTIAADFPIPALFDDLLVRTRAGGTELWLSPASGLPPGRLPWDCTGTLSLPFDGKTEQPVLIPDQTAAQNRTTRTVTLTLASDGAVTGDSLEIEYDVAAERRRRKLGDASPEQRQSLLQAELRRAVVDGELSSHEVEHLDDPQVPLRIRTQFTSRGHATLAGKRLILRPIVHPSRLSGSWPDVKRATAIDLEAAFEMGDTILIQLPADASEVVLPEPVHLDAGPAGSFELRYERHDTMVRVRRALKVDAYRFPTTSYAPLRRWFNEIAAAEERAIVITLP